MPLKKYNTPEEARQARNALYRKRRAELGELREYKEKQEAQQLPKETTNALMDQAKNMLKDKETGEDDPLMKLVEQIPKYLPLVQQLLAGFRDSQLARQINQQAPQQTQRGPTPPKGWLETNPMERLKKKYSEPAWYEAGIAYEQAEQIGYATQYIDATYTEVAPQRQAQIARQNFIPATPPNSTVQNTIIPENSTVQDTTNKGEEIIMKLNQDNAKYIGMAIEFINKMNDEELLKKLEDVDGLFGMLKTWKALIPVHVKEMILATTPQELEQLLKEKAPTKYELLKKNKKLRLVKTSFEKAKEELKN
jgi:hypothetical protein